MGNDLFGNNVGLQDWPQNYREEFWQAYPRKVKKITAMKALDRTCQKRVVEWRILIEAVKHYAEAKRREHPRFIMHAATWLNAGCWDDEDDKPPRTFADIAMGR